MNEGATRYPLAWPIGWKRSIIGGNLRTQFKSGRNEITLVAAVDRLDREMGRLGAREALLSTNLRLGMRGDPLGNQPQPPDRGAAVYFKLRGKDRVLACDRYTTVAGNVAAIAAHIECIRGVDRYGVGTLEQAFAGYDALPAPGASNRPPWRKVLGLEASAMPDKDAVQAAYREKARDLHPDTPFGSHDAMAALNAARDAALREIGAR